MNVPVVHADRIDLVSMSPTFLRAALDGDRAEAERLIGARLPREWPGDYEDVLRFRMGQLRRDASWRPWLVRAIVLREGGGGDRLLIGDTGFHGPPNAIGQVEVGYQILRPFRHHGYAVEAVGVLIDWAARHGVRSVCASIDPGNRPSLAVAAALVFRPTGRQWSGEEEELVFERPAGGSESGQASDRETRPPGEKAAWLAGRYGRSSRITSVRSMKRESASGTVHRLTVVRADGQRRSLVVRRYPDDEPEWPAAEQALREWGALTGLSGSGVPAPQPVFLDLEGHVLGRTGLVASYVPGRAVPNPPDPSAWIRALAGWMAHLHALPAKRFPSAARWELLSTRLGRWASDPDRLQRWILGSPYVDGPAVFDALRRGAGTVRAVRHSLVHNDLWAGNVLWKRGQISGVIDWTEARLGPAAVDLGYARLDLWLMWEREAAGELLPAYREAGGRDPGALWLWDLLAVTRALPDPVVWVEPYRDFGRQDLTARKLRSRLRAFSDDALQRSAEAGP
jgi:aminoglycoside phosphotransferase (APT) family kinase protein/RimJ/RimL family protein N-acetyltransferase